MDKIPIYISPSTQEHNVGYGDYGTEEMRMNMIANVSMQELYRTERFMIYHNRPEMTLTQVVNESNSIKGLKSHTAFHSNSYNFITRGVLGLYCSTSTESYNLCKCVHDEILKVIQIDNGIRHDDGLAEIGKVNAVSTIVECGFHDNPLDAEFIETHIVELGVAYAKGICKHHGVDYIPKPTIEPIVIEPLIIIEKEIDKMGIILDKLLESHTEDEILNAMNTLLKPAEEIPSWKNDGVAYLKTEGYLNSEHWPSELIDLGTFGTMISNHDKTIYAVPVSDWAETAFSKAIDKEIIQGDGNGYFPAEGVTREQMVVVLDRLGLLK